MPKTKISEYSTTNADNTDIEGINIAENCPPSGINNAIREVMVHLKEFQTGASGDGFTFAGGVLISGTANTITGNVVMSGTNTLSGATSAAFAAGTVSAPSIYASGDTNTGVFFPAADTIAITEGGVEVVRVNSSSNVGIGTDSPGSKLDVKGTLRLSGSSSGYVGIAPAAAAGSTTYTLPSADGTSGQVLSTNGSGTLSWATASGGGSSITAGDSKVEVTDTGSNGTITFTTDNSERMRLTSAGLGIAVTPSAWNTVPGVLQLSNGNVRGATGSAGFGSNWFFDGASKYISTNFASDNYQQDGDIVWRNAPSGTAGTTITWTERARIPAAGGFQCVNSISVGNATPTNSGAGITFPATQSASTDANTLDDYEEGTWDVTITPGTSGTVTLKSDRNAGVYTKVGRMVSVYSLVEVSSVSSPVGTNIRISIPFTSQSTVEYSGYWGSSAGGTYINPTVTARGIAGTGGGIAYVTMTLDASTIVADTQIYFNFTYFV